MDETEGAMNCKPKSVRKKYSNFRAIYSTSWLKILKKKFVIDRNYENLKIIRWRHVSPKTKFNHGMSLPGIMSQ
jgi:hypothetical protein